MDKDNTADPKQNSVTTVDPNHLVLSKVDTTSVVGSLHALFKTVMSGDEYNKEQVKSATNISNAMVKVLRFEFDVRKYFDNRTAAPAAPTTVNTERTRSDVPDEAE